MANTTTRKNATNSKTQIQETNKDEVLIKDFENLKIENQKLKEQIEQTNQKMEQMLQMFQQMSFNNQFVSSKESVATKDIEVISLSSGTLVLTTTGKSDGRHYEFNKQFDSILIPENDLKLIIKAMPKTTENGRFFINDTDFIDNNGLTGIYRNILPQEKIEDFFQKPFNEAMEIYHSANKVQKTILESMITDKCLKNEFVDANILMTISRETGKDYMNIEPLLKEE